MDLILQPFANQGNMATPPQTDPNGFVNFNLGYTPDYEIALTSGNAQAKGVERAVQNYLFNQLFQGAQLWQQMSFAPWYSNMPNGYAKNAIVLRTNNGVQTPYRSLVANNTSDPLSSPASWEYVPYFNEVQTYIPMQQGGGNPSAALVTVSTKGFNTFTTNGTWEIQSDAIAAGMSQSPSSYAGMLEVQTWSNGSATVTIQRYTDRLNTVWTRSATGGSWTTWSRGTNINGDTLKGALKLFGGDTGTTAAQYDNSTALATTAFVRKNALPLMPNLGDAVDLNTITTSGIYHQPVTSQAADGTNYPAPYAGELIVYADSSIVYQMYTVSTPSAPAMYVRTYSTSWGAWHRIAYTDSPAFSGTPTAPTAPNGTSTTQLATTAFVQSTKNGLTPVDVSGNSNVTLTSVQAGVGIITLSGTLTGNIVVYVPPGTGQYIFANNTTGGYSLSLGVSGASGATALVPQGQSVVAYSDATNVILAGAAATASFVRYFFDNPAAGKKQWSVPYSVGNILVLINGDIQSPSDITATDGATVTITNYNNGNGCIGNEHIDIIAFNSFTVANAMTPAGGAFSGPVMLYGGDTGVTPQAGDSSNLLATTAFVQTTVQAAVTGATGIFNNTNASADIPLAVGQSAFIDVTSATTVPLHISCGDNQLYEIDFLLQGSLGTATTSSGLLLPNNTTYTNKFYTVGYSAGSSSVTYLTAFYSSGMPLIYDDDASMVSARVSTKTIAKHAMAVQSLWNGSTLYKSSTAIQWLATASAGNSGWDTTTAWTSLGTISAAVPMTGRIIIRRIA